MLHDSHIPSDGRLLTRFMMRRLRLAMIQFPTGPESAPLERGTRVRLQVSGDRSQEGRTLITSTNSLSRLRGGRFHKTEHFQCSHVLVGLARACQSSIMTR